jgi:hypothetical protein
MIHCAYLYIDKRWIQYDNQSDEEVAHLRSRGAVIMHQVVQRIGNNVYKTWVSDAGTPIIERTDFNVQ